MQPSRFFGSTSADEFEECYLMLRFGYNELARGAISRALPRYHFSKFRPKLHLLEHAVLDWKPKTHGFSATTWVKMQPDASSV